MAWRLSRGPPLHNCKNLGGGEPQRRSEPQPAPGVRPEQRTQLCCTQTSDLQTLMKQMCVALSGSAVIYYAAIENECMTFPRVPELGPMGPQAAKLLFSTVHTFLGASSFWGDREQEDLHSLLFFFVLFFCLDLKILESLMVLAQPTFVYTVSWF